MERLLIYGLNHKTAPIAFREQLAFAEQEQPAFLHQLMAQPTVDEVMLLSTCNRTELYCIAKHHDVISTQLAQHKKLGGQHLQQQSYLYHREEAVKHSIRVASGLDSMMLGEPQIFGQMKQALSRAQQIGSAGKQLRQLFQQVFAASKRIRHQSTVGHHPVTVAYASLRLIKQIFADLSQLTVFLIGTGDIIQLMAKYLRQAGCQRFLVANRTLSHANQLAKSLSGNSIALTDIAHHLPTTDIVVTATACPLPFIGKGMVENAVKLRKHRPMVLLDLAVPRDIEPETSQLPDVFLYNIDDLQQTMAENLQQRQQAAEHAEQLVDIELENYLRWQRLLKANATLKRYRGNMEKITQEELQRALAKLNHHQDIDAIFKEFAHRLSHKLSHHPMLALRKLAAQHPEALDMIDFLGYLPNK